MKLHLTFALATSAALLAGCEYPNGEPNNTASGALIGGGAGAITGAAIGGSRHGGEGALIGAAVGAITGGLIGNTMDQEQQERLHAQAPQTYVRVDQGRPLTVADVKALVQSGVSDDVIISQISSSHTVYRLGAQDIIDLHNSGVSDKVINYMINTPNTAEATAAPAPQTVMVVQQAPPPPLVETVVVAPGPGFVWIGGEWAWHGGWVWVGGHWGYPPHPQAVWVRGSWYHGSRGWSRSPGHWR
jgi:outer membrane lipoprotein SlyB